jgi:hypothetical protein
VSDIDGLTSPRDCFDVGRTYGADGSTQARMWASLAASGADDLDDEQRANLEEGWQAGRADFEAANAPGPWRDEPFPVVEGDEIPF